MGQGMSSLCVRTLSPFVIYFIWGFNAAFNTVQAISRRVVLWAEETSTYSWCQGSVL